MLSVIMLIVVILSVVAPSHVFQLVFQNHVSLDESDKNLHRPKFCQGQARDSHGRLTEPLKGFLPATGRYQIHPTCLSLSLSFQGQML